MVVMGDSRGYGRMKSLLIEHLSHSDGLGYPSRGETKVISKSKAFLSW